MSIFNVSQKPFVDKVYLFVFFAVGLIAVGSFTLSFAAQYSIAIDAGIPRFLAWIWPLIVDLSVIIYTAAILVCQLQKWDVRYSIALAVFYGGVTITGNILHSAPDPISWFVNSLPPLSLIFGTEMLRILLLNNVKQNVKPPVDKPKPDLTKTNTEPQLSTRQLNIVNLLSTAPDISVTKLSDKLDVSRTTVYNDLRELETTGQIAKNGNGWQVTK